MAEIKPCPFCGNKPIMEQPESDVHMGCWNPDCVFQPSGNFDTKQDAIEAWNKRCK